MSESPNISVKICGLKTAAMVVCAAGAGADYVGFNHVPKSPRFIAPAEAAPLAGHLPTSVKSVALLVDPENAELQAVAYTDMIQLHGAESPDRCAEIAALTGKPVIKALGVASEADLVRAETYKGAAAMLLLDAKPVAEGDLPGGNGIAFDWRLLQNAKPSIPWMLAGGLTPENVAEAIRLTGASCVDVSSGIEKAPGEKSEALIRAFLKAAKET